MTTSRRLFSRRAARRVAKRAHEHGVPKKIAHHIAYAARKHKVRYALAFAMFDQESSFEVIYGHDAGGLNPGERVTEENYLRFRAEVVRRQGGGANGVGLGQVTWWTYIRDHAGLWKPKVQVYLATSIFADLVHRLGEFTGAGAYNGGEGNPNEDYAREVLERANDWRRKLAGKDSR
jgi:soluble lytic murein transglycosylase-like protein